jgi:hypothetical protein
MLESRMKRRAFGLRSEEVTGDWRELHEEELYNSYSSLNIIVVIISKMR